MARELGWIVCISKSHDGVRAGKCPNYDLLVAHSDLAFALSRVGVPLGPNPPNLSPNTIFSILGWKRTIVWGLRHDFERDVDQRTD